MKIGRIAGILPYKLRVTRLCQPLQNRVGGVAVFAALFDLEIGEVDLFGFFGVVGLIIMKDKAKERMHQIEGAFKVAGRSEELM